MKMHGWGKYPVIDAEVSAPSTLAQLRGILQAGEDRDLTPRGLGRSYGDSSLGEHMISTRRLNHLISFDSDSGVLHCEAGVSLSDILEVFVPLGWFLPVTPGTRFVTAGGAVASDVHGKNHHLEGCFCEHVVFLDVMPDADLLVRCSADDHAALFHATCGGMGLTGMIVSVAIRLKKIRSAFIDEVICKARNLEESLNLFSVHAPDTYSVAWVDCLAKGSSLGRSLLMTGEHARNGPLERSMQGMLGMPVDMPSLFLNPLSVRVFNTLYYHCIRGNSLGRRVHYSRFFYPLDRLADWNRIYGKSGFIQYQFMVPESAGHEAMAAIMKTIVASGKGSFLAVLKAFGEGNGNLLSFPRRGFTLALDFRIEHALFPLLERLDAMVLDYGGRLYLTKDARMSGSTFRQSYPLWEAFQKIREAFGARRRFTSLQSHRLGLDE